MRTQLQRHPLIAFFVLTFAFTWALWLLAWRLFGSSTSGGAVPLLVAGASGPTLCGFVIAALTEGRAGARELWERTVRWRISPGWLAFAALSPFAIGGLVIALRSMLGEASIATPAMTDALKPLGPVLGAVMLLVTSLIGGPVNEEIGWRGYALPRMIEAMGALRATVSLGVLWAFWHLPLFLIPGTSQHESSPALFVLLLVTLSFLYTALSMSCRGSALVAIVFHYAFNVSFAVLPIAISEPTYIALTAATAAVVVIITWPLWSRAHPGQAAPSL